MVVAMTTTKKTTLKITVPGEPITKANALKFKWDRSKRRPTGHIDAKFVAYESAIKEAAETYMQENKLKSFSDGPVKIKIIYYLSSNRKKDLLNLPKTTCDALNDVFYKDDCQIVQAVCEKRFDAVNPRVIIEVSRPIGWQQKMKELFWSLPPSFMKLSKKK